MITRLFRSVTGYLIGPWCWWLEVSAWLSAHRCSVPAADAPGAYGTMGTAASGNTPGGRGAAGFSIDATGHLWMFGGLGFGSTGNVGDLNDLWRL